MKATSRYIGGRPATRQVVEHDETLRKVLLACGIVSSMLYVFLNVVGALAWPGYSMLSRAVSELSAIGAPSRSLVLPLGLLYDLLALAFAFGVLESSFGNRALRACACLLIAFGVLGLAAPFTAMHMRGTVFTLTDTMHITLASITVLLMFGSMAFGAAAFGPRFRSYTIVSIVLLLVFGALTFPDAPRIAANQPTPFVGLYERINIGLFMLWVIVLSVRLWSLPGKEASDESR